MEEILSSIKRIIAEEGEAAPLRPQHVEAEDEPDVLELTHSFAEPERVQTFEAAPEPISAEVPIETPISDEETPEPISAEEAPALAEAPVAPAMVAPLPEPVGAPASAPEELISPAAADATRQALASLSRVIVRPDDPAGDNTLEGLVREMLRPMLKEWLDANLPGIVQATVEREVARISGR
jgi:hypothetical protein